jgi:hypothetical protein
MRIFSLYAPLCNVPKNKSVDSEPPVLSVCIAPILAKEFEEEPE